MSPAHSDDPEEIFSWVGGIMYMPDSQGAGGRAALTRKFRKYMDVMNRLAERYGAHAHWAKIELPPPDAVDARLRLTKMRRRLRERFPVAEFNAARRALDPKGVLSNAVIRSLFD